MSMGFIPAVWLRPLVALILLGAVQASPIREIDIGVVEGREQDPH